MILLNILFFFNWFSSKKDQKTEEQFSVVEITNDLGVAPFLSEKYKENMNLDKQTFLCFDRSKTINLTLFNNNYCDCHDCSDEPGSPASANFEDITSEKTDKEGNELLSYFYCKNPGYVPELIPRWAVGDGICDCCDGADEAFNNRTKCANKCSKLEKKRLKLVSAVDQAYRKGSEKYKLMINDGRIHQENAENVYKKYHAEIERLEKAKSDIDNAREYQEPLNDPTPEEAPNDQGSEENQKAMSDSEEFLSGDDDLHINYEDNQVFAEQIGDDGLHENSQAEPETENHEDNNKSNEEETNNEEEEKSDDEEDKNNEEEEKSNEEEKNNEEEIDYENNGKNCSQTIDKEFFYAYNFSFCIDDSPNPYPKGLTYDQKIDRADALSKKIDELKNRMKTEESTIKYHDKQVPPEFKLLGGQEFSKDDFKYTFLEEIKESYSSLGKFKEYKDGEFIFEDGAYCWETQCGKKTRMKFICWDSDALVSVTESAKCEYRAVFATPAVCTDGYEVMAANMTVKQLKNVRKEAGI